METQNIEDNLCVLLIKGINVAQIKIFLPKWWRKLQHKRNFVEICGIFLVYL